MRYQSIPGTGLKPSCICLGTGPFGTTWSEAESFELLDAYSEMGGTFLDTAHNYADWVPGYEGKCASENTIGKWLRKRGHRDRIILGTKGGSCDIRTFEPRSSREEIIGQLNRSLESLGVDCIDLYWFHRDDPGRPVAHFVDLMNEQIAKGKIRHFGCSNWTVPRIEAAMEYARAHGLHGFVANQMWWSLAAPILEKSSDKTVVPMDAQGLAFHTRMNLAAVPFSSQAGGFFAKMDRMDVSQRSEFVRNHPYGSEANVARFERAKKMASDLSVSIVQIGLSYLLSHPFPVFPIVGCRTISQLRDSLGAVNFTLTPEMIRHLDGSGTC